jgi:hypothetical protein
MPRYAGSPMASCRVKGSCAGPVTLSGLSAGSGHGVAGRTVARQFGFLPVCLRSRQTAASRLDIILGAATIAPGTAKDATSAAGHRHEAFRPASYRRPRLEALAGVGRETGMVATMTLLVVAGVLAMEIAWISKA